MKLWWFLGCAALLSAASERVIYSKSFPGSVPAFVSIAVDPSGETVYKEAEDDDAPARLKLEPEEATAIFELARKLDRFQKPLESNLKVANMGLKTLRWEEGSQRWEQKFNYSLDEDARALVAWFDKITDTEQLFFQLERAVKYDKLGVHKAILQLNAAWDRKGLVAVDQFLPLLDRVAKNDSYLNMARDRAAALAEAFRQRKAKPAE